MPIEKTDTYKEQLIALRDNSQKAWKGIYKEGRPMVFKYVMSNSGSRQDAADILQEGVCILMEKINDPNFELTSKASTFLYSICRFRWMYRLREGGKIETVNTFPEELMINPEIDHEKEELLQKMYKGISELGDSCKKIIQFFYLEKKSTKEIAVALGLSNADTVKSQKYRCLKQLKTICG